MKPSCTTGKWLELTSYNSVTLQRGASPCDSTLGPLLYRKVPWARPQRLPCQGHLSRALPVAFTRRCRAVLCLKTPGINEHSRRMMHVKTHFPPDRRSLAKSHPAASSLVANEYSIKSGNFLPLNTSSSVGYSLLSIRRTVDIDRPVLVKDVTLTP